MTNATDTAVQASVSALEYAEAAWRADDQGDGLPDPSDLSDPALLAVMHYASADLPRSVTTAVDAGSDENRWACSYLRDGRRMLSLQAEVAAAVALAVAGIVSPA